MPYLANISFFIFSPLEQFDASSFFLGSKVKEVIKLYVFYLQESQSQLYSLVYRSENEYSFFLPFPFFEDEKSEIFMGLISNKFASIIILGTIFSISSFTLFAYSISTLNIMTVWFIHNTISLRRTEYEVHFPYFFLGLFFSLGFPSAFDFFYLSEEVNSFRSHYIGVSTEFTWVASPQINFSLIFDENLISFFLAFFLLGGSEQEDDEDFILEEEEADFVDDIVAPLFLANLGRDVDGNGELLVKVTTIFSFVLMNNLMGMLPYSDTGTSSLMLTFWVALSIFVSLLTIMIRRNGVAFFFSLFMPAGCPVPLMFLLIPIEFVSYSFRLVSLSVRLFANMMAGHTLLKVIVGFSFSIILMGDSMLLVNLFPIALLFVLTFLEVGVALIQSYIFTILTCIYLKDIFVGH